MSNSRTSITNIKKLLSRRNDRAIDAAVVRHAASGERVSTSHIGQLEEHLLVNPNDIVWVYVESFSDEPDLDGSALVEIIANDASKTRIPIPGWPKRSARVNEYEYLEPGDSANPVITPIKIPVPDGAETLTLRGHRWKSAANTFVVGRAITHIEGKANPPFESSSGSRISWLAGDVTLREAIPEGANSVSIGILAESPEGNATNSPMRVLLLDEFGETLVPHAGLAQHPKHGPFLSVTAPKGGQHRNEYEIELPSEAHSIELRGVPWGAKTPAISEAPTFRFNFNSGLSGLFEAINATSPEAHFVVIDCTAPPLGHETLSLRPNNLALEYSRQGESVLYIPFGSTQGLPTQISENLFQTERGDAAALLDALQVTRRGLKNTYICSSFPSIECVARAEDLRSLGWNIVYEVRDDMEEFNRAGYSTWYHPLLEKRMIQVADSVVTVSKALSQKVTTMGQMRSQVLTIPNGVAEATLKQSQHLREPSILSVRQGSRVVGYVGHLTDKWFDWPLLIEGARRLPDVTFQIVGHGLPENLPLPGNVEFLGPKTHEELVAIAERWRVGIIPFIPSPLTRGVDPNKIYEYFSWGLRVVSAPMGSVDEYPSTLVYRTIDEFEAHVRESLSTDMNSLELHDLDSFAQNSSWAARARQMRVSVLEASK